MRRAINLLLAIQILCSPLAIAENNNGNCNSNFVLVLGGEYRCMPNVSKTDKQEIEALVKEVEAIRSKNAVFAEETSRQLKQLSATSSTQIKSGLREILSRYQSRLDDMERKLAALEREVKKDIPASKSAQSSSIVLDSIPQLSFIPTKKSREAVQKVIKDSKCSSQLAGLEKAISDQYPDLVRLVVATESMDCEEKKYWFGILPSMTSAQIARLFNILDTERKKLEELEIRYQTEIVCLNKKHLLEWAEFQAKEAKTEEDKRQSISAVVEASVEALEHSECTAIKPNEAYINRAIVNPNEFGKSASGALILARLYETKKYANAERAFEWKRKAYSLEPDNWNCFYSLAHHLLTIEDYREVFHITKTAIENNQMSELRSFSEQGVARKIWIYRTFADAADKTRQPPSQSLVNVIREGYNIAKYSLERMPSAKNLKDTVYFAGRFRLLGDSERKQGLKYLAALSDIANKLYDEGVISENNFSDSSLAISWHCLALRDYGCAIRISNKAIAVAPNNLPLHTNLAHGLLLSGSKEEAREIYSKYVGKVVGDRKWESVILDDLTELTAAGVTSPDFRLVRQWVLKD